MDTQVWTAEAIRHAKIINALSIPGSILLAALATPFLMYALVLLYQRTLNRLSLFFLPSTLLLCLYTGTGIAETILYLGIMVNIPGLQISISPVMPSTCAIASKISGHYAIPCQLDRLQGWIQTVLNGGSWRDIWTKEAVLNTCVYGSELFYVVVAGCVVANLRFWWLVCDTCGQGRAPRFWKSIDLWQRPTICCWCRAASEGSKFSLNGWENDGGEIV